MRARGRMYFNQIAPHLPIKRYSVRIPKLAGSEKDNQDTIKPNSALAETSNLPAQPKNTTNDNQDTVSKLDKLVENSKLILFKCKSIFPFDLFPTDVIVDTRKVNIVFNQFFYSRAVQSIPIDNIFDVTTESNPFFAKMKIVDVGYRNNEIVINHLWKKDAEKARDLIQGLIVANQQGVKIEDLSNKVEIYKKIEELGKIRITRQ